VNQSANDSIVPIHIPEAGPMFNRVKCENCEIITFNYNISEDTHNKIGWIHNITEVWRGRRDESEVIEEAINHWFDTLMFDKQCERERKKEKLQEIVDHVHAMAYLEEEKNNKSIFRRIFDCVMSWR
jgi:hypothetical protein